MNQIKPLVLAIVLILGAGIVQAQKFETHQIYCEEIINQDQSDLVRNHFLQQYAEKVSHFEFNLNTQTGVIVSAFQPADVLQIYKQLGFNAIYLLDGNRYELSPDNKRIKLIK